MASGVTGKIRLAGIILEAKGYNTIKKAGKNPFPVKKIPLSPINLLNLNRMILSKLDGIKLYWMKLIVCANVYKKTMLSVKL